MGSWFWGVLYPPLVVMVVGLSGGCWWGHWDEAPLRPGWDHAALTPLPPGQVRVRPCPKGAPSPDGRRAGGETEAQMHPGSRGGGGPLGHRAQAPAPPPPHQPLFQGSLGWPLYRADCHLLLLHGWSQQLGQWLAGSMEGVCPCLLLAGGCRLAADWLRGLDKYLGQLWARSDGAQGWVSSSFLV